MDLIPSWSWYGLYHFDGLSSSLFKFGSCVSHVKAYHTCYSVLLYHDQCRYFVYVNYLNLSICHRLWQFPLLTLQYINLVLTWKVPICTIVASCSRNNVIIYWYQALSNPHLTEIRCQLSLTGLVPSCMAYWTILYFQKENLRLCTKMLLTSLLCISSQHRASHNPGIRWVI